MNKSEVVALVSSKTALPIQEVRQVLDEMHNAIIDELRKGGKVGFTGFGCFHVGMRKQRNIRNPRTGELDRYEDTFLPRFSPGKPMKQAIKKLTVIEAGAS